MKQPEGLLSVLRDATAREDARDDAAIDLWKFDSAEVEDALFTVATDSRECDSVSGSAGESLAEIWIRRRSIPDGALAKLAPVAQREAVGLLKAHAPELLGGFGDDSKGAV